MKDDKSNSINESIIETLKQQNSTLLLSIENKKDVIHKLKELISIQDSVIESLNRKINVYETIQKKMSLFVLIFVFIIVIALILIKLKLNL